MFDLNEYHDQRFERIHMASERVEHRAFYDCRFSGSVLRESQFVSCQFYDCIFSRCDLSLLGVERCEFVSTRFEDSKMMGISWTDATWKSLSPRKIDFYTCDMSYSIFTQLKLVGIHIQHCTAHDVDFTEADLTKAHCRDTDFREARFFRTNLTDADFVGASNYSISPLLNTIKGAKFALPEAISLLRHFEIELIET